MATKSTKMRVPKKKSTRAQRREPEKKKKKHYLVPVIAYKEREGLIEVDDFTHQLSTNSELILRGSGAVFPGAKVFSTNLESEAETAFKIGSKQNQKEIQPGHRKA